MRTTHTSSIKPSSIKPSGIKHRAVLGLAMIIFSVTLTGILVSAPGAAPFAQQGPPWGNSSGPGAASALAWRTGE
jgi:hypothetical protein